MSDFLWKWINSGKSDISKSSIFFIFLVEKKLYGIYESILFLK